MTTVWFEGAGHRSWPGQQEGRAAGSLAQCMALWAFPVLWNLSCKIQWGKLEPPTRSRSCPNALKAHSLHTDKPSQIVSGRRKQAHVTKWEGTQRSCGGDRVIWLQTLPVSCRLEFYAGRWSLQVTLCCCQRNEHVRLSQPASSWLGLHANSDAKLPSDFFLFFFHLHGKKQMKHNLSLGFFAV